MLSPGAQPLQLDAEAVERLLPHRPPFLFVDGVDALRVEPPSLWAHKHLSPSDPVFAGHFPGRPVWPGVYTLEGLAQTCALLAALRAPTRAESRTGLVQVLAGVEVKLTAPVLPGQRLDYQVVWTHSVSPIERFSVQADVDGRVVARGTLMLAEGRE